MPTLVPFGYNKTASYARSVLVITEEIEMNTERENLNLRSTTDRSNIHQVYHRLTPTHLPSVPDDKKLQPANEPGHAEDSGRTWDYEQLSLFEEETENED